MPHIFIETNLPDRDRRDALATALHAEALEIDAFPRGGIRTRLHLPETSLVSDISPDARFAYVVVRLGKGRSEAIRQAVGERLFAVLQDWAAPELDANAPISLGLEVEEIVGLTFKRNTIHDLLKARP